MRAPVLDASFTDRVFEMARKTSALRVGAERADHQRVAGPAAARTPSVNLDDQGRRFGWSAARLRHSLCRGGCLSADRVAHPLRQVLHDAGGHVDLERGIVDFQGSAPITRKRRARIVIPDRLLPFLQHARQCNEEAVIEFEGRPVREVKTALRTAGRNAGLGNVYAHILIPFRPRLGLAATMILFESRDVRRRSRPPAR